MIYTRHEGVLNTGGRVVATKDDELAKLYITQQGLHEWFEQIGSDKADELHEEDKDKRERLRVLNDVTGLPYDKPVQFSAVDVRDKTREFVQYIDEHGDQLCAIRLIPIADGVQKLRMRGKTVRKAVEWFEEQGVDADKYRVDFVPHETCERSTIFVVTENGVFGEIVAGGHHQLTQGFHEVSQPVSFHHDFSEWVVPPADVNAKAHIEDLMELLRVSDADLREQLADELGSVFASEYLMGYFETTYSTEFGVFFKDYNRILGSLYEQCNVLDQAANGSEEEGVVVSGHVGSPGSAEGPVRTVDPDKIEEDVFGHGDVLVCTVTTPAYIGLMGKASAIVTDQGGILSHAAITARELGVPCIVGTGNATTVLKTGDHVRVDADQGHVTRLD